MLFIERPTSASVIVRAIGQYDSTQRWQLRLLADPKTGGWHWLERGNLPGGNVSMILPGQQFHTHNQLTRVSFPISQASGRIGCFTQHGQLFDFKDWFAVSTHDSVTAIMCPRSGNWTRPAQTLGQIAGNRDNLTLSLPIPECSAYRRNLLFVTTTLQELERNDRLGLQGFEQDPTIGHTRWAPQLIAQHGLGHPNRLTHIDRHTRRQSWQRPAMPALCTSEQLANAHQRVKDDPTLAAENSYWAGKTDEAIRQLFDWLQDALASLQDKAHLHPKGNPVYLRPLAPLMALYNLLDFEGKLTDAQRTDGACLIAQLATMLLRRDFYPWDMAMLDDDDPRAIGPLYRGMLNQNFNTDRFVAVGMAGCVLPTHPHAKRWRQHAIDQFELQMKRFVYPGGCWEESHTYANHVKFTLLPLGMALLRSDEVYDMFANTNFAAMSRFFVPLLSPCQADQQGHRLIPAIGDHGYTHHDYSFLFGWLSTVFTDESNTYNWAWEQTGHGGVHGNSLHQTMFHPLLCPISKTVSSDVDLPEFKVYPGYGACARHGYGTDHESMLLVRCGQAWGHYHPDLGSFWWWSDNELICADAQLGQGELKFAHRGHNVLSYVNHHPVEHLDRTPFAITDAMQHSDDRYTITCHLPIERWLQSDGSAYDIPLEDQPLNTRTFDWQNPESLLITDMPKRSPNQQVTWSLHVLADIVERTAEDRFAFHLTQSRRLLTLQCPQSPLQIIEHHQKPTLGLTLVYPEQNLSHHLSIGKKRP